MAKIQYGVKPDIFKYAVGLAKVGLDRRSPLPSWAPAQFTTDCGSNDPQETPLELGANPLHICCRPGRNHCATVLSNDSIGWNFRLGVS